jgi:replicative DNA helicase
MATNESKVISAICKNKDFHTVISLDPQVFGAYGDVFEHIREFYLRHRDVPSFEILKEKFGSIESAEVTAPTPYYVNELLNQFVKTKMDTILSGADARLEAGDPAPSVLEKLQTKLAALGQYTSSSRDVDLMDADAAIEHYHKMREATLIDGGPGIPTGFKSIDSIYTTGFAPGQSIVVMGYTGKGKSMWTALLAVNALLQGKRVMVISLEMSPEEYGDRVYAMLSKGRFKISELARGDVNEDDFRTWAKKNFKNKFIVPSFEGVYDVTPNTVRAKIDQHKPDLVILDYLQLMNDNAKTGSMTPRMMNLSREIKLMAGAAGIPIVSITAVTDEDGDKRDGPPVMSQVAWSKAIEYDANLIIAVHRHSDESGKPLPVVEVVARKSRHSDLFDFGFVVDFDSGLWEEKFDLF